MAKDLTVRDVIRKEVEQERLLVEKLEGLPHLHGQKMYKWQREAFESTNRMNLLTAANQVGKSSILIRKCIHWATAVDLWPKLWKTKPVQFWYLYPSYDLATREYETKWVPEFLPRGKFKDDPIYGWKPEFDKKDIKAIRFNAGPTVYFLAYAQMTKMMQASTVHAIFGDEEIDTTHFQELRFRLMAVNGYFHSFFTATQGQEMWRCAMEDRGQGEIFPNAWKKQVTLFECQHFEDGTPSHWTRPRIEDAIASCVSEQEVQRRIYGKFVISEGRRYPSFSRAKNVRPPLDKIPDDWFIFSGVDIGSGAERGHPSAITFLAIRPDFKLARAFKHWNGKGHLTTASDVLQKFIELRGEKRCVQQFFDYSAADFGIIASRAGENFSKAKKDRESGDNILNSLFRNEMLIVDDIEENGQLIYELETARDADRKTMARDDSCFIAGTTVQTLFGEKPIEQLAVGDLVITRKGPKPIIATANRLAGVSEYLFSNGDSLVATANHPVFTNGEFKQISLLTHHDTLLTYSEWLNQNPSSLMALSLGDIQSQNKKPIEDITAQADSTLSAAFNIYIKRCGSITTGLFRQIATFITKTATTPIMIFQILNWLTDCLTELATSLSGTKRILALLTNTLNPYAHLLPSGTNQKMGANGTRSIGIIQLVKLNQNPPSANSVNLITCQNNQGGFVPTSVRLNGVGTVVLTAKKESVPFVERNSPSIDIAEQKPVHLNAVKNLGTAKVYNIRVAQQPEYFANGILVHNCDSLRYASSSAPWNWEFLNPQAPDGEVTEPTTTDEKRLAASRRISQHQGPPELDMNTTYENEVMFWQTVLDS